MARRTKDNVWDKFSRIGVILVLLYVMFIILGFAVRLLFFSDERGTSIIPMALWLLRRAPLHRALPHQKLPPPMRTFWICLWTRLIWQCWRVVPPALR